MDDELKTGIIDVEENKKVVGPDGEGSGGGF